jgi:hypothetical protein
VEWNAREKEWLFDVRMDILKSVGLQSKTMGVTGVGSGQLGYIVMWKGIFATVVVTLEA